MLTAKQSYTPDFQEWGVEHQASSKHCSPSRSSMERWFTALKKKKKKGSVTLESNGGYFKPIRTVAPPKALLF